MIASVMVATKHPPPIHNLHKKPTLYPLAIVYESLAAYPLVC